MDKPWQRGARESRSNCWPRSTRLYVLAQSEDRVNKERSMRRRQLKGLWSRLKQLSTMKLKREVLLMKLGAAEQKAPSA